MLRRIRIVRPRDVQAGTIDKMAPGFRGFGEGKSSTHALGDREMGCIWYGRGIPPAVKISATPVSPGSIYALTTRACVDVVYVFVVPERVADVMLTENFAKCGRTVRNYSSYAGRSYAIVNIHGCNFDVS